MNKRRDRNEITDFFVLREIGLADRCTSEESREFGEYLSPPPIAVSVSECCRYMSLGRTKIYQLIRDGRLKASRIDRRTLVVMSSVRALIADGVVDVGSPGSR